VTSEPERVYLAVCALYRDDAPYLAEWIEFHRLVGVERFFLYDNGSLDEHRSVLRPDLESGTVILHEWPGSFPEAQMRASEHCIASYRDAARWIAFLDVDEFLFSPASGSLPEALAPYERHPAVGVNWAMYGTSGHREKPEGLVTESYLDRTDSAHQNRRFKSIVDPARVAGTRPNVHRFELTEGQLVDELERPIHGARTETVSFERLRINHYWTKSEQEARRKYELWQQSTNPRAWATVEKAFSYMNEVRDDVILRHVPELRRALDRRAVDPGR
jgi:hypothetical protein